MERTERQTDKTDERTRWYSATVWSRYKNQHKLP